MEPRVYEPSDGTRIVAHVVYGLHTVSILLGLMTGASIAGAFIFSWPSILAVILNYIFRGDAEGTYLESHFAWQIRTFWLAGERLEFGRGLSTEGEPALWEIDDTGAIVQWIEVGCPDVKQVRKAAGRSEHVQIVAYGEDRVEPWWEGNKGDFAKIGKLTVVSVPDDQVTALASMASRNMKLAVTIQDGILWISDDRDSLQIEVTVLQTEHERYSDF